MKKIAIAAFVCLFVLLGLALPGYADSSEPIKAQPENSVEALSVWTNQRGSTLTIDAVSSSGQLTGTYINRAPNYPQCRNIPYPVTGWVYGTAITFTTKWQSRQESCNSITAWTGFLYRNQIQTLWQLVINGSTNPRQIQTGSDIFSPA